MLGKITVIGDERTYSISSLQTFIGQNVNCDIRIYDKNVSPQHCLLTTREEKFATIRNLTHTGKTLVNRKDVGMEDVILQNDDVITIGKHNLKWNYSPNFRKRKRDSSIEKNRLIAVVKPHRKLSDEELDMRPTKRPRFKTIETGEMLPHTPGNVGNNLTSESPEYLNDPTISFPSTSKIKTKENKFFAHSTPAASRVRIIVSRFEELSSVTDNSDLLSTTLGSQNSKVNPNFLAVPGRSRGNSKKFLTKSKPSNLTLSGKKRVSFNKNPNFSPSKSYLNRTKENLSLLGPTSVGNQRSILKKQISSNASKVPSTPKTAERTREINFRSPRNSSIRSENIVTPNTTPKAALQFKHLALTEPRRPVNARKNLSTRFVDALYLEKSAQASNKLKLKPHILDKNKLAALLLCHKKKSPEKSLSETKPPIKRHINQNTPGPSKLPSIRKLPASTPYSSVNVFKGKNTVDNRSQMNGSNIDKKFSKSFTTPQRATSSRPNLVQRSPPQEFLAQLGESLILSNKASNYIPFTTPQKAKVAISKSKSTSDLTSLPQKKNALDKLKIDMVFPTHVSTSRSVSKSPKSSETVSISKVNSGIKKTSVTKSKSTSDLTSLPQKKNALDKLKIDMVFPTNVSMSRSVSKSPKSSETVSISKVNSGIKKTSVTKSKSTSGLTSLPKKKNALDKLKIDMVFPTNVSTSRSVSKSPKTTETASVSKVYSEIVTKSKSTSHLNSSTTKIKHNLDSTEIDTNVSTRRVSKSTEKASPSKTGNKVGIEEKRCTKSKNNSDFNTSVKKRSILDKLEIDMVFPMDVSRRSRASKVQTTMTSFSRDSALENCDDEGSHNLEMDMAFPKTDSPSKRVTKSNSLQKTLSNNRTIEVEAGEHETSLICHKTKRRRNYLDNLEIDMNFPTSVSEGKRHSKSTKLSSMEKLSTPEVLKTPKRTSDVSRKNEPKLSGCTRISASETPLSPSAQEQLESRRRDEDDLLAALHLSRKSDIVVKTKKPFRRLRSHDKNLHESSFGDSCSSSSSISHNLSLKNTSSCSAQGIQKLFNGQLFSYSPIPDYNNVTHMNRVFTTSPVVDYTDVTGVKKLFTVSPQADYTNPLGMKELFAVDKAEFVRVKDPRQLFFDDIAGPSGTQVKRSKSLTPVKKRIKNVTFVKGLTPKGAMKKKVKKETKKVIPPKVTSPIVKSSPLKKKTRSAQNKSEKASPTNKISPLKRKKGAPVGRIQLNEEPSSRKKLKSKLESPPTPSESVKSSPLKKMTKGPKATSQPIKSSPKKKIRPPQASSSGEEGSPLKQKTRGVKAASQPNKASPKKIVKSKASPLKKTKVAQGLLLSPPASPSSHKVNSKKVSHKTYPLKKMRVSQGRPKQSPSSQGLNKKTRVGKQTEKLTENEKVAKPPVRRGRKKSVQSKAESPLVKVAPLEKVAKPVKRGRKQSVKSMVESPLEEVAKPLKLGRKKIAQSKAETPLEMVAKPVKRGRKQSVQSMAESLLEEVAKPVKRGRKKIVQCKAESPLEMVAKPVKRGRKQSVQSMAESPLEEVAKPVKRGRKKIVQCKAESPLEEVAKPVKRGRKKIVQSKAESPLEKDSTPSLKRDGKNMNNKESDSTLPKGRSKEDKLPVELTEKNSSRVLRPRRNKN